MLFKVNSATQLIILQVVLFSRRKSRYNPNGCLGFLKLKGKRIFGGLKKIKLRKKLSGPITNVHCSPLPLSVQSDVTALTVSSTAVRTAGLNSDGVKCRHRGCSSMAERQLPKLHTRVRFPSPAPHPQAPSRTGVHRPQIRCPLSVSAPTRPWCPARLPLPFPASAIPPAPAPRPCHSASR